PFGAPCPRPWAARSGAVILVRIFAPVLSRSRSPKLAHLRPTETVCYWPLRGQSGHQAAVAEQSRFMSSRPKSRTKRQFWLPARHSMIRRYGREFAPPLPPRAKRVVGRGWGWGKQCREQENRGNSITVCRERVSFAAR